MSTETVARSSRCPVTEVGWKVVSSSAQRPRTYHFDVVPSSATPCTDVSIQDPPGVCAFQEATSSSSPNGVDTCGEVQVASSYSRAVGVLANGSV